MSESIQLYLPFDELDITNASENNVPEQQTAIQALSERLSYVDPVFFGADTVHFENEQRFVAMRREWMEQANDHFIRGSYALCVASLQLVREDVQHAGYFDQSCVDAISALIELCYEENSRAKGSIALAEVVVLPTFPEETPPDIVPSIAS